MPEFFNTLDDYERGCPFWAEISLILKEKYDPNPWIFKSAYRPYPQRHYYVLTFRNFDGSEELHFTYEYRDGQDFCSLCTSPNT